MEHTRESPAARIVDRLGGISKLARKLGHRWPTKVQGWKERGVIPSQHIPAVIEVASREGITLTLSDFFDVDAAGQRPTSSATVAEAPAA